MKTATSYNFTAKDRFNMTSAVTMEKAVDQTYRVVGACVGTDTDENGNEISVAYLKTEDEHLLCTVSKTVISSVEDLIDYFEDGESVAEITVEKRMSKGGREFLVLMML